MAQDSLLGAYFMMGFRLDVQESGDDLMALVPGVPAGYEIRLEPLEGERFRMHGGPAAGSVVEFKRDAEGRVLGMYIGNFELARLPEDRADGLPVIERLIAPRLDLTPEKEAAFSELLAAILAKPDGGQIVYELAYPKYEFVQYVMAQEIFIFHGSNNREITEFAPVRTSVELFDRGGSGNLQAVYGTHDGLWAMFFAVVNRKQLSGSIRNGVMYMHNRAGEQLAVYNFSVNQAQLAEHPWTDGALYFLPREAFERQKMTPESYSNEWACHRPVKPVARLDVKPEDFPFLSRIGGHDDGLLIRAESLGKAVRAAALAASLEEARLSVTLPNNPKMAQTLQDWIEIQRVLTPAAVYSVEESAAGLQLVIDHLPPAYRQVYSDTYRELLNG